MKRSVAFLAIAGGCCAALAADIPPPHEPADVRLAARGQVELYVATSAARDLDAEDERLWGPALALGREVIRLAQIDGITPERAMGIDADFPTWRRRVAPQFARTSGTYTPPREDDHKPFIGLRHIAVRAAGVTTERPLSGLVVSRGPVTVKTAIMSSLVLATGDVAARDIMSSVVICDGDVTTDQASCSLIIARGKIVVKRNSYASGLVAGDTAEAGKVREYNVPPLLRADDPVALAKWRSAVADANMHRVIVRTKVANPLGFVTFFELSRVGLTVKAVDGAVTVAAVAAGLPCAKAGLKAGDAIADVGGKKPADAESLRRLLRDALAVGPAAVAVRRGGAALTIQLSLPE